MKRLSAILILASAVFAGLPARADTDHEAKAGAAPSAKAGLLSDGEVRRVDKDAQKITVRHGPLPDLDMPNPMTMVYRVKDPAMLDRVKAGDKVKFQAEKISGAFTIVQIEPAKAQ
jgi:Cu/Ag efflux protein CusF